jgi:hypothetical protein
VRENNSKDADIEHLLGNPLIFLSAVGRHTDHRRDRWREAGPFDDLPSVEHKLKRLAQPWKIERRVFHLESDAVELRACHGHGAFDIHRRERNESGLTVLEGFDYAV